MERIDGHTILIGLMATPIRHSMSPTMHNNAFAKLGLNYAYLAFEVGHLICAAQMFQCQISKRFYRC